MASIQKRPNGKYRARYRDETGREHAKHFTRKADAQQWLDEQTAAMVTGQYVDPKSAKMTVEQWCETWLEGYGTRRPATFAKLGCISRKSFPRSERCGSARSVHRMSRHGRRNYASAGFQTPTFMRCIPGWHRSTPTPYMTGSCPGRRAPAAHRRLEPSSGRTWPLQTKCGACTMRCRLACAQRSC